MRDSSVAACAISARSVASCTELEDSIAKPVERHGHGIRVVAKDRQRLRGDRARGNMNHRRGEFARDLVHIGDHQQQALRGREGRAEGAGLQRAMHRAGSSALALHLGDNGNGAPDVFLAVALSTGRRTRPWGRGRNGIDGNDFGQAIGDRSGGLVAVENRGFFGVLMMLIAGVRGLRVRKGRKSQQESLRCGRVGRL